MFTHKKILVGTDFSPRSESAVHLAAELANRFKSEELHIVHVADLPYRVAAFGAPYSLPANVVDSLAKDLVDSAQQRLDALTVESNAVVNRRAVFGIPSRVLAEEAQKIDADLLVLMSRGLSGLTRFILGSLAGTLLRTSHCPVFVAREGVPVGPNFNRILAAVDLSGVSRRVLENAFAMARVSGGTVHVVSAFERPLLATEASFDDESKVVVDVPDRYHDALKALVSELAAEGTNTEIDIFEKSPPARVILDIAEMTQPDLIVVGTSGHGAWHRMLLGSTANRIVDESASPVVVVPFDAASLPEEVT